MNTQELAKLKKFLSSPKKIAIIMHKSPDGDAIGSSLGMYHFLAQLKHKCSVISPNAYPDFLKWMPGTKLIIDFSKKPKDATKRCKLSGYGNMPRL